VLILKPSGFRQLLAKLWITHPILKTFFCRFVLKAYRGVPTIDEEAGASDEAGFETGKDVEGIQS